MKIFKDILNALKIETVYIISDEHIYFCAPLEIIGLKWIVACDSENILENSKLKIKYNGSFIYLKAKVEEKKQDDFYSFIYTAEIDSDEKYKDQFKKYFFKSLSEMENNFENWNKRKEKRYDIGLDENIIKKIDFKSAQQTVICDKKQLPCVVNNISYSGAKITTLEANFSKDKKICLVLSFLNPIEQIPLMAQVKNCIIKSAVDKTIISVLSLKFIESSYEFKKRLDNFIKDEGNEL